MWRVGGEKQNFCSYFGSWIQNVFQEVKSVIWLRSGPPITSVRILQGPIFIWLRTSLIKPFLFAFEAFCPCAILNHQAGRRSDNGSFRCCFSIMLPINSTSFTNSHHSHMNPSPLVSCVYDQVSLLLLHPKSILYDLLDQVLCFSQLPHLWMHTNLSCFKGWNCLETECGNHIIVLLPWSLKEPK